jgi:DNA-directed RNA polymerase specialized sigma24 family protein
MANASKGMTNGDETVRLLALLIRLLLPSQKATILELNKAGFGATRIADLLGTSTNTANVAIQQAKKKAPERARVKLEVAPKASPTEEDE